MTSTEAQSDRAVDPKDWRCICSDYPGSYDDCPLHGGNGNSGGVRPEAQPAVSGEMVSHWAHVFEDRRYSDELVGNMVRANADLFLASLSHSTQAQGDLASEIKAAIEAWHDCAPSGQGEGWAPDATEKFNAMATLLYENSETICSALLRHPASEARGELANELERLAKRTYDFEPTLENTLRAYQPRGMTGHDWTDKEAFDRLRAILALVPAILAALRHPASVVENPFAGTTFETRAERAERLGVVEGDGAEAVHKDAWDDLRRYIYDRTPERREQSIARFQAKFAALASTVLPTEGEGK